MRELCRGQRTKGKKAGSHKKLLDAIREAANLGIERRLGPERIQRAEKKSAI